MKKTHELLGKTIHHKHRCDISIIGKTITFKWPERIHWLHNYDKFSDIWEEIKDLGFEIEDKKKEGY